MRVKYLPWQPHCLAFGGLEVQMLSTLKAVQNVGVDADKLDIWSRDSKFDILHIWGLDHIHAVAVRYGSLAGKKIVITALFQDYDDLKRRYKHYIAQYIGITKSMINIASAAQKIVVVNDIEAHIANKYFKIPSSKISYIPNIVDERFFVQPPKIKIPFRGISNYILCTGNICKRKNQLNLAKACKKLGINLIVIGKILIGEEEYGNQVLEILNGTNGFLHVENLMENSDELIASYHNCEIFALPSIFEQGPISAYEALVCGNKLLIADKRYSYQEFYQSVERVNPESVESIANGILAILKNPDKYKQPLSIMESCKASNVGQLYKGIYKDVMNYQ